jgi:hypothetical protein
MSPPPPGDPVVKYVPTLPAGNFIKFVWDDTINDYVNQGVVPASQVPASQGGTGPG